MIDPYPRYLELYQKSLDTKPRGFNDQDMTDLQVYFNLVWFHPQTIKEDKNLQILFTKGKFFNQHDKEYLVKKQWKMLLESLVPACGRLKA